MSVLLLFQVTEARKERKGSEETEPGMPVSKSYQVTGVELLPITTRSGARA